MSMSTQKMATAALKAVDVALGVADYALEAAQNLTRQLARQGRHRREELVRRLDSLAERGNRLRVATRDDLERLRLRLATQADIERLEARVAALEKATQGES